MGIEINRPPSDLAVTFPHDYAGEGRLAVAWIEPEAIDDTPLHHSVRERMLDGQAGWSESTSPVERTGFLFGGSFRTRRRSRETLNRSNSLPGSDEGAERENSESSVRTCEILVGLPIIHLTFAFRSLNLLV